MQYDLLAVWVLALWVAQLRCNLRGGIGGIALIPALPRL